MTSTAEHTSGELITPDEFKEWLDTFRPNEQVGWRALYSACPIAQFLRLKLGNEPKIDVSGTRIYIDDTRYRSDDWIWWFIRDIDLESPRRKITASRARGALRKARSK